MFCHFVTEKQHVGVFTLHQPQAPHFAQDVPEAAGDFIARVGGELFQGLAVGPVLDQGGEDSPVAGAQKFVLHPEVNEFLARGWWFHVRDLFFARIRDGQCGGVATRDQTGRPQFTQDVEVA